MKIYITALYSRRHELREVDHVLRDAGHEPTSQWIWNAEESKGWEAAALMDVEDVRRADAILFFGQPKGSYNTGGGRWFELGLAYAEGKEIFAVLGRGGAESLFLHLPQVHRFDTLLEALQVINDFAGPQEVAPPLEPLTDRYSGGDPAAVQGMVMHGRQGHPWYRFTEWEQGVLIDARDAGRATIDWDDTVTGRLAQFFGIEALRRVRWL